MLPLLSTSSLSVDYMLGGGLMPGSIIEVFGEEDVGKTSLALGTMSAIPNYENCTLYIDLEKTLFSQHALHFGLDPKHVNVARPDTLEQTLSILRAAAESGSFKLIILDSIPALISATELKEDFSIELSKFKGNLLVKTLRSLLTTLAKNQCTVILINQLRNYPSMTDPSVFFETSPGGLALKALCTTRLKLERLAQFLDPNTLLATVDAKIDVVRHVICEPKVPSTNFRIVYSKGFDNALSAAQLHLPLTEPYTTLLEPITILNLSAGLQLNYTNYRTVK